MQCVGATLLQMRSNIFQITLCLPPFMINLEFLILGYNNIVLMKPKYAWNLMIPLVSSRELPCPILHTYSEKSVITIWAPKETWNKCHMTYWMVTIVLEVRLSLFFFLLSPNMIWWVAIQPIFCCHKLLKSLKIVEDIMCWLNMIQEKHVLPNIPPCERILRKT